MLYVKMRHSACDLYDLLSSFIIFPIIRDHVKICQENNDFIIIMYTRDLGPALADLVTDYL